MVTQQKMLERLNKPTKGRLVLVDGIILVFWTNARFLKMLTQNSIGKVDRITDERTAPLKVEPSQTGSRVCSLCYFGRRKVRSAKSDANISAIEQMVNVLIKRILALPVKNTISSVNLFLRRNFVKELHLPSRV
jgi:hypothetical protein